MAERILTKEELKTLSELIGSIETRTAAELRVVVRHKRHWTERKLSPRQIAEREFRAIGMAKTKKGTGILVFILVGERKFELLADHGIIRVLPEEFWSALANKLSGHFSKKNFFHGLNTSIKEIGEVLEEKLPPDSSVAKELPNDVIEE